MEAIPARLGSVAGGQHALITAGQMAELKITRNQRAHLLATGHIVKVGPRIYVLNGAPFTWQARIAAAWLAFGADAVVSHRSAAALYSLEGFDQQKVVHLSLPAGLSPKRRKDVQFHRCVDFELIRPELRQNILVTDPARLVLHLYATERNPEVARRGLFSARKKKLVTWAALEECLEQHARKGRRGIKGLRADLDLYRRTGCPETSFEDAIRQLLVDAGLPEPELQHWVVTPGGRYRIHSRHVGPASRRPGGCRAARAAGAGQPRFPFVTCEDWTMSDQAHRRWVDSMSEAYDRWMVPTVFLPFAVEVASRIAARRPRRVLELAAGTGVLTRELLAAGTADVTATDLNEAMVEVGRRHVPGATWQSADALDLPFDDGRFDVVVHQFGVMFFPDKPAAHAEARRVLEPDGSLFLTTWGPIEGHDFEVAVVAGLEQAFPDDPPRFLQSVPHGYADLAVVVADLRAGGLEPVSAETVTLEGQMASAVDLATGYCTGTPLRAEIEARGDLAAAIVIVAEELGRRIGTGPVAGRMTAHVVEAAPAR